MMKWIGIGCLLVACSAANTASAAILTETFSGKVLSGVDGGGLFGEAGASLVNKKYTASFTYDTSQGTLFKFGNEFYGYQQLTGATTVSFTIEGHTQSILNNSYSNTEHDTFFDYGYRSVDDFGPASIATDDVYSDATGSQVYVQVVLKNQSIPLDLTQPYTADFSDGIDSEDAFFNFQGLSAQFARLAKAKALDQVVQGTSGTLSVDSLSASLGSVSVPSVPLPASAPLFGAAILTLGAVGYAMKRKGNAAA